MRPPRAWRPDGAPPPSWPRPSRRPRFPTSASRPSSRPPSTWLSPWSWVSPCCEWPLLFPSHLFFAKRTLRVEVADSAALAAGRRVDHGVDEGRLAGVHGLVHGALQFVRRRHMDADAAERFHHLVVARAFDEDGRRDV